MGGRSTFSPVHWISSRPINVARRPYRSYLLPSARSSRSSEARIGAPFLGNRGWQMLRRYLPAMQLPRALRVPRLPNCFGNCARRDHEQQSTGATSHRSFKSAFLHLNSSRGRKMLASSAKAVTRHAIVRLSASPQPSCRRAYASSSCFLSSTRPRHASRACSTHLQWHCLAQTRGAKRKATLSVNDIPQGAIDGPPLPPQDDELDYPPLLQQVRNNLLKFSHCVLLTRVGGFYEASTVSCCHSVADSN